MQRLIHILAVAAVVLAAANHASEDVASRWLAEHHQAPGADELNELKGANPEAYAIVKALMMKQSLGLIKRKHGSGGSSMPVPDLPEMPPALEVVAQGTPTDVMGAGPPPPAELPELAPQPPTAPPAMPPPPPVSPDLPPALDEAAEEANVVPAPAPAPTPVRLSAAATSSSVSTGSGGGGFGLNWHPDQMIAENERMVSNVLGAVAQLTGKHTHRAAEDHQDGADSPLSKDELPEVVPQEAPHRPVVDDVDALSARLHQDAMPAQSRNVEVSQAPDKSSMEVPAQGGFGLNWHPDQMIAENERMVQSVLGSVAQLTGAHVHRAAKEHQDGADSPLSQDAMPTQSRNVPSNPKVDAADLYLDSKEPIQAEHKVQTPADAYLASKGPLPAEARPVEPSDDGIAGHLPGSVSWSNPYTFTASANVGDAAAGHQNSYLRDVDFGIPVVKLPPKRSSDDDNPYLNGLDLTGDSARSAPAEISASALTAMHQSQLLSSHTILYEHDSEYETHDSPKQRKQPVAKTVKVKKDALGGFLAPVRNAQPKSPPASLVNKNTYLAKLGEATTASYSGSSTLASNIEQDNPYLQALDDAPTQQQPPTAEQVPVPAVRSVAPRPQLSMTSSRVQQKANSNAVAQKATQSKSKKKKKQTATLSGWLGGGSSMKVPDVKAQRLQQAVALRVADARNPYLNGLDIDSDAPKKVQAKQDEANPYMASLD